MGQVVHPRGLLVIAFQNTPIETHRRSQIPPRWPWDSEGLVRIRSFLQMEQKLVEQFRSKDLLGTYYRASQRSDPIGLTVFAECLGLLGDTTRAIRILEFVLDKFFPGLPQHPPNFVIRFTWMGLLGQTDPPHDRSPQMVVHQMMARIALWKQQQQVAPSHLPLCCFSPAPQQPAVPELGYLNVEVRKCKDESLGRGLFATRNSPKFHEPPLLVFDNHGTKHGCGQCGFPTDGGRWKCSQCDQRFCTKWCLDNSHMHALVCKHMNAVRAEFGEGWGDSHAAALFFTLVVLLLTKASCSMPAEHRHTHSCPCARLSRLRMLQPARVSTMIDVDLRLNEYRLVFELAFMPEPDETLMTPREMNTWMHMFMINMAVGYNESVRLVPWVANFLNHHCVGANTIITHVPKGMLIESTAPKGHQMFVRYSPCTNSLHHWHTVVQHNLTCPHFPRGEAAMLPSTKEEKAAQSSQSAG